MAYCSELSSSASIPSELNKNANKRHGSLSSGDIETKSCKRPHCGTNGAQFYIQDEGTCSDMQMKPMKSSTVAKSGESASNDSREVYDLNETHVIQYFQSFLHLL